MERTNTAHERDDERDVSRRRFAKAAVAALAVVGLGGAALEGALARHGDDDSGGDGSGGSGGSGGNGRRRRRHHRRRRRKNGGSGGSGGSGNDD